MPVRIFSAMLVLVLLCGGDAVACACCTNAGQRNVTDSKIDAYASGLLGELRFAPEARLYVGEADIGNVKGIKTASDALTVGVLKSRAQWQFAFDDGKGNKGTLRFVLPATVTKFEVDPRESGQGGKANEPVLYKEWRMTSEVAGSGMFTGSTGRGQRATLILHGRGNSCTDASQFNAWTIVLHGPKSSNTIFGALQPQ